MILKATNSLSGLFYALISTSTLQVSVQRTIHCISVLKLTHCRIGGHTINLWQEHKHMHTFRGHQQAVRGLLVAIIPNIECLIHKLLKR